MIAGEFVALEMSPDAAIAKIASEQHRDLFNKHETMYEKENVRVRSATWSVTIVERSLQLRSSPNWKASCCQSRLTTTTLGCLSVT